VEKEKGKHCNLVHIGTDNDDDNKINETNKVKMNEYTSYVYIKDDRKIKVDRVQLH
jgi:hypothetical protein